MAQLSREGIDLETLAAYTLKRKKVRETECAETVELIITNEHSMKPSARLFE
jgi:hypothetical protein